MDRTYWHKQTLDAPLYPDLLWSRPENRTQTGKLAIVGGNAHGFAAAAEAYAQAEKAGVGTARVLLPDSLQKTVGRVFEAGEYAPSTPSGSLSQKALSDVLSIAQWGDALLLAGDLGRNSETAILIEGLCRKYTGQLTITKDAVNYVTSAPNLVLDRPETLLVLSFSQLQKLAISSHFNRAFTFDIDFLRLIDYLHEYTTLHKLYIVTKHLNNIFVAVNGEVSTTKLETDMPIWRIHTATSASVWWLQNPQKPFEAIISSIL
jgi:hypothetical protein